MNVAQQTRLLMNNILLVTVNARLSDPPTRMVYDPAMPFITDLNDFIRNGVHSIRVSPSL